MTVQLVSGWITALVSLSVRLMSGSCQTSFLLCTIFLFGSNARLITACFLLLSGSCQALYCSVQFGSCPVDVRPTSGSNVWLCLGPCPARHFLMGILLWQYISMFSIPLVIINYVSGSNVSLWFINMFMYPLLLFWIRGVGIYQIPHHVQKGKVLKTCC